MVWSSPDMDLPGGGISASPEMAPSSYHNLANKGVPTLISHYEAAFTAPYRQQSLNNNNSTPPPLTSPSYIRSEPSRFNSTASTIDPLDQASFNIG